MDQTLSSFSGAHVRRVVDHSNKIVAEHAHDWPVLSIFVLGAYDNATELGEMPIGGPSAIFYRAGASHQNRVGPNGFEQIEIEFDPAWLGLRSLPDTPVTRWVGGRAARERGEVARICRSVPDEDSLRGSILRLLMAGSPETGRARPAWIDIVERQLRQDQGLKLKEIAPTLGRHPSWLGTAYRRATGESLADVAARLRVERAAKLLRETGDAPASIAADAGFCDQSHMIRTFRRLLGRTPANVRADRAFMR